MGNMNRPWTSLEKSKRNKRFDFQLAELSLKADHPHNETILMYVITVLDLKRGRIRHV